VGLQHENTETARRAAVALGALRPVLAEPLARTLVELVGARRGMIHAAERLLVAGSGRQRPGYENGPLDRRIEETERTAAFMFWKKWYQQQFGREFSPTHAVAAHDRTDEELHRFLLSDASLGGSAARGGPIYERLQCHTCHGGGAAPGREGRLFGPDLAGVTRRLTRAELAEALVFPSKQVADRFKATEVALKDGTSLIGFITEQDDEHITLSERDQIRRIDRKQVERISPQTGSLMPDRLLASLTDEELRDLMAFLNRIGTTGSN
jgi:putative heme-binding domain-containing protein